MLLFLQTAIIKLARVDVIVIGHDRCWRLLDGTAAEGGCLLSMNNVKHRIKSEEGETEIHCNLVEGLVAEEEEYVCLVCSLDIAFVVL